MKNRTKIMTILLGLMILIPSICSAAYLGSEIPISTQVFNQQNPFVIFLPDKNLYFVVWEDWRNQLSTGSDIYGRFLKSDGSFCGNEFIISNAIGNQTAPVAAYRDGAIQNRSSNLSDKILVVWQDTRRTSTNGLIFYRDIDVSNINVECSGYVLGSETAVLLEDDEPLIPGIQSKANSRVKPKITYDVINDRFVIAWVESRTTLKTSKFQPFPLNPATPSWSFGDTQFVGYTAIRGDISGYQTLPNIIHQWMDNGAIDTFSRARLLNRGSESMKVVSSYEFFDSISSVDVSCDTTTPECLFGWEGKRGIFTRTDECTNVPKDENDDICDEDDSVGSKAETRYEPANREIFGLFEKSIPLNVITATQISIRSGSASEAFMPSIGFDPISKRFLVVWEDTRDNVTYKKIYGQLVYSGSGLYNSNFIISFQDTDGDGRQDANVANSKQTNPFVSYDAVNQRFFVIWQDGRNSAMSLENLDIYGQKVDAEGSLRGGNFAVYNLPYNQLEPVIANNPVMDEFIAVWKDARYTDNRICGNGSQPCGSDIFGQLFTLGQPSLTLLNLDNTPLSPPILQNFQNPSGSGSVKIGSFASQSFKIRNTGDVLLKIDYVDLTCGGAQSELIPFSLEGLSSALADRDGNTVDIVPSAEFKFIVIFKPLLPGTYNKCFIIETDGGKVRVNLSAYAIESRKGINVNPEFISFPATTVDSSSTQTLTIINSGSFELIISSIINPTGDFSISDSSCGGALKQEESCQITLSFSPTKAGFQESAFVIKSNDPEVPSLTIPINGIGRAKTQKIDILPAIIDFGTIVKGSQKTDKITIQNNGGQDLIIKSVSYPKMPFSVNENNCSGQTLKPGASCDIGVAFSPRYRGKYSGSITIKSNDPKRSKIKVKFSGAATL